VQGHYEKKGLAHVISAVPPPEEVFEEVIKALDLLLKQAPAPKQPVATIAAPAEPEPAAAAAPEQQAEEASPPEMAPIAAPAESEPAAAVAPEQQAEKASPPEMAPIAAPAEPEPAAAVAPEQQAEEASPPEMAPIDAAIVFVLGKPKAEFTHENETKCCFMHTMPIHSPYTSIAKWV